MSNFFLLRGDDNSFDIMFVYIFVDPDQGFEIIFQKNGATELGAINFAYLYWGLKKIWCRTSLLFYLFFWWQKVALKALLALTFILGLYNGTSE